jgi:hypothetical protein
MPGQYQHEADGHRVTLGSADGPVGDFWVSQQDGEFKMTTVYDSNYNVVKENEYVYDPAKGGYKPYHQGS